jgi:hypothetical protein
MVKEITAVVLSLIVSLRAEVAYAQRADCFTTGGAKLPSKVTFDDGSTIAVLDRVGDKLRTETTLPDGRKSNGSAYRGLFVLIRELPTTTVEFNWNQDLAHFFPLKVGEHIVADAMALLPTNKAAGRYFTEMSVVAQEIVRIGSCDYPVLKIEVSSRFDQGAISGKATHYYHTASMLNLKSIIPTLATTTMPSKAVERHAIRIE